MIYLNYAATTSISKNNLDVYYEVSTNYPSLSSMNKDSRELEEQSKEVILNTFNTDKHGVYFTTSGTYANSLAILGYVKKFDSKKHFITTSYEHQSMRQCFEALERDGHSVTYVKPNNDGIITMESIKDEICSNTVLVSIMHMNNELGTINDVNYIFGSVKNINSDICTVSDMCQSVGKVNIDLNNIDIVTYTSHKIYGVKNLGVLLCNKSMVLKESVVNSTIDLGSIVTTAKATKYAFDNLNNNSKKLDQLGEYIKQKINNNDKLSLNVNSYSNIFSIYVNGNMLGESIVSHMFDKGIEISTRSACSTKDKTVSSSLKSINLDNDMISKTIRLSISHLTTYDEIDIFFNELNKIV